MKKGSDQLAMPEQLCQLVNVKVTSCVCVRTCASFALDLDLASACMAHGPAIGIRQDLATIMLVESLSTPWSLGDSDQNPTGYQSHTMGSRSPAPTAAPPDARCVELFGVKKITTLKIVKNIFRNSISVSQNFMHTQIVCRVGKNLLFQKTYFTI